MSCLLQCLARPAGGALGLHRQPCVHVAGAARVSCVRVSVHGWTQLNIRGRGAAASSSTSSSIFLPQLLYPPPPPPPLPAPPTAAARSVSHHSFSVIFPSVSGFIPVAFLLLALFYFLALALRAPTPPPPLSPPPPWGDDVTRGRLAQSGFVFASARARASRR